MYSQTTNDLLNQVKTWFDENNLNHAIVGYSGGIDSATTAALLAHAGIVVTLVQFYMDDHKFSSNYDVKMFASVIKSQANFKKPVYTNRSKMPDLLSGLTDAGKEAALPILRNAYLYAIAADAREFSYRSVVVGTANFDEAAYLGFWGKASDGAQDYYPISHLHKSQVYALAKELGVPPEIIGAVPSGDLQWSGDLNDHKMIGATYPQIEAFAKFVDSPKVKSISQILEFIDNNIDDPQLFVQNIDKNSFKYDLPFPNVHAYPSLEIFRKRAYPSISIAAAMYLEFKTDHHKNQQSS